MSCRIVSVWQREQVSFSSFVCLLKVEIAQAFVQGRQLATPKVWSRLIGIINESYIAERGSRTVGLAGFVAYALHA